MLEKIDLNKKLSKKEYKAQLPKLQRRLYDLETGEKLLSPLEAQAARRAEAAARREAETRAEAAETRAEQEAAARREAEEELARLRAVMARQRDSGETEP